MPLKKGFGTPQKRFEGCLSKVFHKNEECFCIQGAQLVFINKLSLVFKVYMPSNFYSPNLQTFQKGGKGGQESFIMSKLLLTKPPLMGGEV